jgi:glutamate-1-semialdehyde 2,1-aminomutase
MSDRTMTNSRIETTYRQKTAKSAELFDRANQSLPGGLVHDARIQLPYPLYIARAAGSRKWDVDGNEYVDYYGGHGSLLLGHSHPEVVAAVARQMQTGTHFAGCSELEVRWAELVRNLIPCADLVRFTASGTEATLMTMRLARAFTGRSKIVHFHGHFHGWQDHVAFGVTNHFDGTPTPGVLKEIADNIVLVSPNDPDAVRKVLTGRDDIAAVILEPTGASWGMVPLAPAFVAELRALTAKRGILLIFDEVITGFRASKGGAQQAIGVMPDMCSLAKILAGGLPGGAVCGRRDIIGLLDGEGAKRHGIEKIGHQGTFNGNPLSAAAGTTALDIIARTDATQDAIKGAHKLRSGLNRMFREESVPWAAYGEYSGFYIFTNPDKVAIDPERFDASPYDIGVMKRSSSGAVIDKLRLALLINGVDLSNKAGGSVSAVHSAQDIDTTVAAFRAAVRSMKDEGDIA